MSVGQPRWVIHLPTTMTSRAAVTALAVALRDSLGYVTALDFGESTVSLEDAQSSRTRIWCDVRLAGGGRCALAARHAGPCR